MSKIKELIHIMRQHSTVTFTLHGLGETIFECSYFDKAVVELDQLEVDAELWRAVRKAVKEKYGFATYEAFDCFGFADEEYALPTEKDIKDLLDWAKEAANDN